MFHMLKKTSLIISLALCTGMVHAAPATDATIEKLMTAAHSERMLDAIRGQVMAMQRQMLDKMLKDTKVNEAQRAILDRYAQRLSDITMNALNYNMLKDLSVKVYKANLSEEEVQGILDFYATPAGKALVEKMPKISGDIMAQMPAIMEPMLKEIQAAAEDMEKEMKQAATPAASK